MTQLINKQQDHDFACCYPNRLPFCNTLRGYLNKRKPAVVGRVLEPSPQEILKFIQSLNFDEEASVDFFDNAANG